MMTGMSDRPSDDALPDLPERVEQLERRAAAERRRVGSHERDLARIGPQVAALEERVEALRERLEPPPDAEAAEGAAARSLLEEVRREHAQVRIRVSTLVKYEERIRQLEDEVARLRGGEVRAGDSQPAPKN